MNDTYPRIWILSQFYYPEDTSTGYSVTRIAEGLAAHVPVRVICGFPGYTARNVLMPSQEERKGVRIHRSIATPVNNENLTLKLLNQITVTLSIFAQALWRVKRRDFVLVVSSPPLLPFVAHVVCRLRGAKSILLIHDVYPDVLIASGVLSTDSLLARFWNWLNMRLYQAMEQIVVLGRDMQRLISRKAGCDPDSIAVITNTANIEHIVPTTRVRNALVRKLDLERKFIVKYSGHMGRTHGLEWLLEAVKCLSDFDDIHFLFVGEGPKRSWLEKAAADNGLHNLTILPYLPRDEISTSMTACDVQIITLMPGMAGISVPGRLYDMLAAGKPIIAVVDSDSEIALVVTEEEVGWVVPPDDSYKLVEAIRQAYAKPQVLADMGRRARLVAEEKYSLDSAIDAYVALIRHLDDA